MTDLSRVPPLVDPRLIHQYRQQTPGYSEYASQALQDLFPTPVHLLEALGIPLLSDAASLALGAKDGSGVGMGMGLLGALPFVPGIVKRTGSPPAKTQKAYKLFRAKNGKLYPLFVDANEEIPVGDWLRAEAGQLTDKGKVKSKLGPLAYRPGWHAGDFPIATHIGEGGQPPKYRPANQVWAEVDLAADVDWQKMADERGINRAGKKIPAKAHITDQVPYEGFYRYKTNPNMTGEWLIGGDMKVNRILTDEEVAAINKAAGLSDLPRRIPLDLKLLGF